MNTLRVALLEAFGSRIKRWRTDAGLSQFEVAVGCGCSLSTFRRWEWGEALPSAHFFAVLFSMSEGELYLSADDIVPLDEDEDA